MNAKAAFLSPWRTIPKVFTGKKVGEFDFNSDKPID